MRETILLYTLMAAVLVFVLVFFASQLLLEPLKNILRTVQSMAEGHLNQRISVKGKDEYSQMATSFNNMSEKLEQVDKARSEFVSNVSHELKTPLSAIKVLADSIILQEEELPIETYREFLQDITSEIDRMTYIVNDLLELVKLDRREQGIHMQPCELNQMVEAILKRLSPLAEQKRIVLLYEDVRQVTLDADAMKLSLAISNIVLNGIKYTPAGGTVKVILDADHQFAFITVHDTGIGIPEEEQSNVFNRFYRVDKTRDRGTGGTGLGLAISHAAVLLHNGNIRVSSKPDEGSVFVIRLPIRRSVV
jgi:signal transduction histidine kinase